MNLNQNLIDLFIGILYIDDDNNFFDSDSNIEDDDFKNIVVMIPFPR